LIESYTYCIKLRNLIVNEVGKDIKILFDMVPKLRVVLGEVDGMGDTFYNK